jgi:hypothetical protein
MVRKILVVLIPAAAVGAIATSQWPDIKRYLKIKQMSQGQGHPENVPAGGTTAYPAYPEDGVANGTGDFDSAGRGGPAAAS